MTVETKSPCYFEAQEGEIVDVLAKALGDDELMAELRFWQQ